MLSEAENFGRQAAQAGFAIVYGGSTQGPMGSLAEGVLSAGGDLIGVVPEMSFMDQWTHPRLSEKRLVRTLAERKSVMIEHSDAFVCLPGGIGTLDELTEIMALRQVGAVNKPLVLHNFLDYWGPLLDLLDWGQQNRMIQMPLDEVFQVFETSEDVIKYLKNAI